MTTSNSKAVFTVVKLCLHEYNAKHAQFRILPRYKVKSEGEYVESTDQVTFESIKSRKFSRPIDNLVRSRAR
jgi:hypothetical protein